MISRKRYSREWRDRSYAAMANGRSVARKILNSREEDVRWTYDGIMRARIVWVRAINFIQCYDLLKSKRKCIFMYTHTHTYVYVTKTFVKMYTPITKYKFHKCTKIIPVKSKFHVNFWSYQWYKSPRMENNVNVLKNNYSRRWENICYVISPLYTVPVP